MLSIAGVPSSTYYDRKKMAIAKGESLTSEPIDAEELPRRGRPPTSHSKTRSGEVISNAQIEEWLMELVSGEEHGYGYELLTDSLRRHHELVINKKKT